MPNRLKKIQEDEAKIRREKQVQEQKKQQLKADKLQIIREENKFKVHPFPGLYYRLKVLNQQNKLEKVLKDDYWELMVVHYLYDFDSRDPRLRSVEEREKELESSRLERKVKRTLRLVFRRLKDDEEKMRKNYQGIPRSVRHDR
ncbi:hypothetical protein ACRW9N_10990 [Listeria aquatica]|uniref:hypothetical protein n=1 Tax=Listeria aquatica TaxID=1494960 RepID=UPI003EF73C95